MVNSETQELVTALLARVAVVQDAHLAFAQRYPDAPPEMIGTAAFHVCDDGIEAAMDWLAAIERFLRDPNEGMDYGATWHLVYHLYNWQQFQALLPLGKCGLGEHLNDVLTFLKEDNAEAATKVIHQLIERLGGDLQPPSVD